jgi:soluble lytic murein transglycosylase-like protein
VSKSSRSGRAAVIAVGVLLLGGLAFLGWWRDDAGRPLLAALQSPEERLAALAPAFERVSAETGLDAYLLAGLVYSESRGKPDARSRVGALGLCQLALVTAREQAERLKLPAPDEARLLEDPELNLRLGAHYLARMASRFDDDVSQALMAYNTGPSRFAKWLKEAGGFEPWIAERREAGSHEQVGTVVWFADRVQAEAQRLREAGVLEPPPSVD